MQTSASVIVTFNLADFPTEILEPLGIEAQHPDEFISRLIDLHPDEACAAAKSQRASLKNPSRTVDQFLDALARQQLPDTVARLRGFAQLI